MFLSNAEAKQESAALVMAAISNEQAETEFGDCEPCHDDDGDGGDDDQYAQETRLQ